MEMLLGGIGEVPSRARSRAFSVDRAAVPRGPDPGGEASDMGFVWMFELLSRLRVEILVSCCAVPRKILFF